MTKYELHTPSPIPYLDWTDSGFKAEPNIAPIDLRIGSILLEGNNLYEVTHVDAIHVSLRSTFTGLPMSVPLEQIHKSFKSI